MASFLEAQLGFAAESTWGTRVTSTSFLPFLNESMDFSKDWIQSQSYRAGRIAPTLRRPGGQRGVGDVTMELAPQGLSLWLKHCFGNVSTSGAGPYTHTITPTATTGLGLSMQIVRTDDGGTARPFDYSGLKVTKWDLSAQVGGIPTLKTSLYGTAEDTSQSIATQSLPANLLPFVFTEASLTVAGTAVPVMSFDLQGDNGLSVDRMRLGSATSKEPIQKGIRAYTGNLDADFSSLTLYNLFKAQTQSALVLTFQQSVHSLVITMAVEFDGKTANATGIGNEVRQPLPFTGINATSDAGVITAVLINADATP